MKIKSYKFDDIKSNVEKGIIESYISKFDFKDSDGDIIIKGAFKKTIQENIKRIKFLWQHERKEPIGRPLELKEDNEGVFTVSKVSRTDKGEKALILARDGVLNEFSVGFKAIQEAFSTQMKANVIKEVKLWEYSIVTWGANELAQLTDMKDMFKHYEYSKGNVLDILAEQIFEKLKALKGDFEPSKDTHNITYSKSLQNKEQDDEILSQLLTEIKKMKKE